MQPRNHPIFLELNLSETFGGPAMADLTKRTEGQYTVTQNGITLAENVPHKVVEEAQGYINKGKHGTAWRKLDMFNN